MVTCRLWRTKLLGKICAPLTLQLLAKPAFEVRDNCLTGGKRWYDRGNLSIAPIRRWSAAILGCSFTITGRYGYKKSWATASAPCPLPLCSDNPGAQQSSICFASTNGSTIMYASFQEPTAKHSSAGRPNINTGKSVRYSVTQHCLAHTNISPLTCIS